MARKDGPTANYFRPKDIAVFKQAAKLFKVYIAVRRINPESLAYAGVKGYTPKLIDCKAKTAEHDIRINGKVRKLAGLVIDCDVYGRHLAEVFGKDKVASAVKEWKKFTHGGKLAPKSVYGPNGKVQLVGYVHGYSYFTQMDPDDEHYGCIRHSLNGLWGSARYVHGDYDLYAVVPADNPSENVFVTETRLGEAHSRSPHQADVQTYVTAHIPGMVAHGEQDTFKDDPDDDLDVFFPDGQTVMPVIGAASIRDLYATLFRGRQMFAGSSPTSPAGGSWRKVG